MAKMSLQEMQRAKEERTKLRSQRQKMPRTKQMGIPLAPGIAWDYQPPKRVALPRVFDKRALQRLGIVDHFANILPVLSKRFSVHRSVPDFELPPEHDCWNIWPPNLRPKYNGLPNTFATHTELFGFKQIGLELRVAQEKYEKALKGPLKRKATALDGTEYEQFGVPGHPSIRQLAGIYDPDGRWIPRVPGSPKDAIYVESRSRSSTTASVTRSAG
eukprot:6481482-Amphidinium_carterae.1